MAANGIESIELRMCGGAEVRPVKPPPRDEMWAIAEGACPYCKASPFRIGGKGKHIAAGNEGHNTYVARAECANPECNREVGVLAAKVSTIFGLEEDERVTAGPWRVY